VLPSTDTAGEGPEVVSTVAPLRTRLDAVRAAGETVGFVPTMGALHEGHASLIRRAQQECAHVVVSIFVNPLQFDRADDLARYPRSLEDDLRLCAGLGVRTVFAPAESVMYPTPPVCTVDVGALAGHLCGRHRPGHFRGVATVVLKLFQMIGPSMACFGEKDAQQLAIVRRLVSDFSVPVVIVGVPTVREPDGLALSSRNRRLSPGERAVAPRLYQVLQEVRRRIEGGARDVVDAKRQATLAASGMEGLEYLEVVDPDTMQPVATVTTPVIVAGALWVGATRLIDNVRCLPPA
jgi:pantoate--beta-alanine ligase